MVVMTLASKTKGGPAPNHGPEDESQSTSRATVGYDSGCPWRHVVLDGGLAALLARVALSGPDDGILDFLFHRSVETRTAVARAPVTEQRDAAGANVESETDEHDYVFGFHSGWAGLPLRLVARVAGAGSTRTGPGSAGCRRGGILAGFLGDEDEQLRREHHSGGGRTEGYLRRTVRAGAASDVFRHGGDGAGRAAGAWIVRRAAGVRVARAGAGLPADS